MLDGIARGGAKEFVRRIGGGSRAGRRAGAGPTADDAAARQRVEAVIEKIRPQLQADHGDIELVEIDGKTIYVSMLGACNGCAMEHATLGGIQQKLIEEFGEFLKVLPASRMPVECTPRKEVAPWLTSTWTTTRPPRSIRSRGGDAAVLHRAVRQPLVDAQLRRSRRQGDQEGPPSGAGTARGRARFRDRLHLVRHRVGRHRHHVGAQGVPGTP